MTTPLILSLLLLSTADAAPKHDLVRRPCVHASYPDVCLRTLSSYGSAASTPRDLVQAALRVSLARVRKALEFLTKLKGSGRREQRALNDCVEQMVDTVDELNKKMTALQHFRRGADFRWQMSNAKI